MRKLFFGLLISSMFSIAAFANCPNVQFEKLKCVDQITGEENYIDRYQLNNNLLTVAEGGDQSSLPIPADMSSDGVRYQSHCADNKLVMKKTIEQTGDVATSNVNFLSNGYKTTGKEIIWECIQSATNDCDSENAVWTTSIAEIQEICTVE